MQRYRVRHGNHLKTVSLDSTVTEYLALHSGTEPCSREAYTAIRAWLQSENRSARRPRSHAALAMAAEARGGIRLRAPNLSWSTMSGC